MDPKSRRWQEITRAECPWGLEALAFVREGLPDHEPYATGPNFEFIGITRGLTWPRN